jgi:hypothetical protein
VPQRRLKNSNSDKGCDGTLGGSGSAGQDIKGVWDKIAHFGKLPFSKKRYDEIEEPMKQSLLSYSADILTGSKTVSAFGTAHRSWRRARHSY